MPEFAKIDWKENCAFDRGESINGIGNHNFLRPSFANENQ